MDNHMKGLTKKIGVWISDKKSQKLNWNEFHKICNEYGYDLIKLDFDKPLEEHLYIDVFLHKLIHIVAEADVGEEKACAVLNSIQQHLSNNPRTVVIDPFERVKILLKRSHYYAILKEEFSSERDGIYTPQFAEFKTNDIAANIKSMTEQGIKFPVVCKPTIAHGSKLAHEMTVIFNEKGLVHCKAPCVVQNFVNHNAVLHKVSVVGNRYHIFVRPSLKNFYAAENLDPIFFITGDVCKADSQSTLSILDPSDHRDVPTTPLDEEKVRRIIKVLQKRIGLLLLGFDVVICNATGNHAVIDINVFPSYDKFPNLFEHVVQCIDVVREKSFAGIESSDLVNVNEQDAGHSALNGTGVN